MKKWVTSSLTKNELPLCAPVMCSGLRTGSDKDTATGAWALITSLPPSGDVINWVHHRTKSFQNVGLWFDILIVILSNHLTGVRQLGVPYLMFRFYNHLLINTHIFTSVRFWSLTGTYLPVSWHFSQPVVTERTAGRWQQQSCHA